MDYQTLAKNHSNIDQLPSESLIINGVPMEEIIPGFRTLSVSGRELSGRSINAVRRGGGDGALLLNSRLDPRILTVRYRLEASDNDAFRMAFNQLNIVLHKSSLNIRFLDELEYSYTGTLETAETPPEGRNTVVSALTFYCADPYKYSEPMLLNGTDSLTVDMETHFDMEPKEITVTPANDTSTLTIRNGDLEIQLVKGSFLAGRPVLIAFGDDITVTNENGSMTDKIALHSDLENFVMNKGDKVELVEGGQIEIKVSRVML